MADVIDRVRKLIALSSSSNENEARAAALQACRLMVAHGLVVAAPENGQAGFDGFRNPPPPVVTPPSEAFRRASSAAWNFFDAFGRALFDAGAGAGADAGAGEPAPKRARSPKSPRAKRIAKRIEKKARPR